MHLGIIPDGNRRWCRLHGLHMDQLMPHHTSCLLQLLKGGASHLREVGGVTEVTLYGLSADNVLKRTDGTLEHVYRMLDTLLCFALVGWLADGLSQRPGGVEFHEDRPSSPSPSPSPSPAVHTTTVVLADHHVQWLHATAAPRCAMSVLTALRQGLASSTTRGGSPGSLLSLPRVVFVGTAAERMPGDWVDLLRELAASADQDPGWEVEVEVRFAADDDDDAPVHVHNAGRGRVADALQLMQQCAQMRRQVLGVRFIGQMAMLPPHVVRVCSTVERVCSTVERTLTCRGREGAGVHINIALAYDPVAHSREVLLDDRTGGSQPIDMVVRTGGEQRSSGFFPLQTMYSEWFYTPCLFPDFTESELERMLCDFAARKRRFGA
jgi:undecaprenyl pyrophosphate synthase